MSALLLPLFVPAFRVLWLLKPRVACLLYGFAVKAEIGDVNRFRSGGHLCSYAGLVPSTYNSGGVTRHGGITREGSRWLRWAMVEAAMLSMTRA